MSNANGAPAAGDDIGRKRALLRLWLTLTVNIGSVTFFFYQFIWAKTFAADNCRFTGCALGPVLSALTSLVFAAGVALLIAILLQNRGRYRQVFRFSRARVIGAAVLAALAPVVIYSGLPWILLPGLIFGAAVIFSTGSVFEAIPMLIVVPLIATAVAYPISCLLVSGLRKRLGRFAGFTLIWWSAYCLVLMLYGLRDAKL
ncbi:MAG TPA: hypothetical protein PLI43_07145 [Albidovulum sp.]|uniref:hypothetical protein n=1 Tax=Albidovulum sp. TaxID=1872424 RepID=UPI002D1A92D5|nr:hypothetical protein [Albidovulum sp.]